MTKNPFVIVNTVKQIAHPCVQFYKHATRFLSVSQYANQRTLLLIFYCTVMKSPQCPARSRRFILAQCVLIIALILSAIIPVSNIFAQNQTSIAPQTGASIRTFTLEECLTIATGENLEVQSGVADVNNAVSFARTAYAQFLPTLSVNASYGRLLNDRTLVNLGEIRIFQIPDSAKNNFGINAALNYTLFDGLFRDANYKQTLLNQTAAEQTLQQTRRRVLATVRSRYLAVLRNKQILRVRQEDFAIGTRQLERIRAQYDAGVVAIAPVYTQESDVANRELAIVQAENDLEAAKGTLLTTLGMNPGMASDFTDVPVQENVSESDIRAFRTSTGDFGKAFATASDKRLDYSAAKLSVESAEAGVRAANAAYLPTVSAQANYNWSGTALQYFEYGRQSLGVGLNYNVFDGFIRDASVQRAQIVIQQNQIRLRQAEQVISADVQNAFIQLNAAEKNLDITARALKAAEQNFNAAEERFKVGAANILDYTIANSNRATARVNRVTALYNYVAAQYQVRFAVGTLDD
jgi:outer membrane protein